MSGGLLIDKPVGWTSHDVVAVIRRQLGTRAVGHAGTLDPFATGLLVVLVGKATRLARFVEGMGKRYRAVVRFGAATDTDDATGEVVRKREMTAWPDRAVFDQLTASMVGAQMQVPPVFSAKHVAGTRSHVLARRGEAVLLRPVEVRIDAIDLLDWSPPDLTIEASVGRGTYVRSLARDMGDKIGIPAHCAQLRRLAIGSFSVDRAIAPAAVTSAALLDASALLPGLPSMTLDETGALEIGFGRPVLQATAMSGTGALLTGDGRLLAVAEGRNGWWYPVVVLETAS